MCVTSHQLSTQLALLYPINGQLGIAITDPSVAAAAVCLVNLRNESLEMVHWNDEVYGFIGGRCSVFMYRTAWTCMAPSSNSTCLASDIYASVCRVRLYILASFPVHYSCEM
jgi:hypothetical protein